MPRLADRLLKVVIYLYSSVETAEGGEDTGGSGFIVGQPTTDSPDLVFLWGVTNWHVAKRGRPVIRTAGAVGNRVINRDEDAWIRHYGHDLVATPLGFADRDDTDSPVGYVPREWFVEPDDFVRPRPKEAGGRQTEPYLTSFGPGDETVTLGRFLGYQGRQENTPVARFGNLAVGNEVPLHHPRMAVDQPSFLVEARSLSGYSGSPVFVYRARTAFFGSPVPVEHPRLLGIDWGHLSAPRPGESAEYRVVWPGDSDESEPVSYNAGIMTVIPAWHLASILDSDEAVAIQRDEERKRAESMTAMPVESAE